MDLNRKGLFVTVFTAFVAFAIVFLAVPFDVAYSKEGPSEHSTLVISNGILKVAIDNATGLDGVGTFTIATDVGHPHPVEDIFYEGAYEDPWSSFTTIRVEDVLLEYVTSSQIKTASAGYDVRYLDAYTSTVNQVSGSKATISWVTAENLNITLLIDIRGTSLSDTIVEVTVTIRNDDASAHSVALRHEWDIMVDGEDDSWIRVWSDPNTPQAWTENETDWVSPGFVFWETTNNPLSPMFSIYGSIILPSVTPSPTPPDRLVYASWAACEGTAYDFSTSGEWGMDSAILYYWNAVNVDPGAQIRRTAYVTTVLTELEGATWSVDSAGDLKSTFLETEDVYVTGQGFPSGTAVTIYLLPDGQPSLPTNAVASVSTTTNSSGHIPTILVWSQPLTLGKYDIWIDTNQNSIFDAGDVRNSQAAGIYAVDVISELLSTLILPLSITATLLAMILKRKQ